MGRAYDDSLPPGNTPDRKSAISLSLFLQSGVNRPVHPFLHRDAQRPGRGLYGLSGLRRDPGRERSLWIGFRHRVDKIAETTGTAIAIEANWLAMPCTEAHCTEPDKKDPSRGATDETGQVGGLDPAEISEGDVSASISRNTPTIRPTGVSVPDIFHPLRKISGHATNHGRVVKGGDQSFENSGFRCPISSCKRHMMSVLLQEGAHSRFRPIPPT